MTVKPNMIRSAANQSRRAAAFPSAASASDPIETLLIVDDDHMLRDLEAQLLRQEGYTVLAAEGAAEAMRVAGKDVAIHLLITDFMMPDIDGLELTRRFRMDHPETPVLMVSGSCPPCRDQIEDLCRFEFLAKPFGPAELLHKVRDLLEVVTPLPR